MATDDIELYDSDVDSFGGAPPPPSALTDIILALHSSLYGAKRSVQEVREIMQRYYEGNAVFSSPLVYVHGRERIVDQFVIAFATPTVNVVSELRDVICSDFEFDGTRAGIIDHKISVTFFPWLVGQEERQPRSAGPSGGITPHPFADDTHGFVSPTPPPRSRSFSIGGRSAWPRTPRSFEPSSLQLRESPFIEKPLSAGVTPLPLGADSLRWSADGLGRTSLWVVLGRLLSPRQLLYNALTVKLRVLSRLELNETGRIVRHEDIWSTRELIEGLFPLISARTYWLTSILCPAPNPRHPLLVGCASPAFGSMICSV